MSKKYPNISRSLKNPNKERDGEKNYGKPCVMCRKSTIGQKWVQVSWFRGEDEIIRVCAEHWKTKDIELLEAVEWTA